MMKLILSFFAVLSLSAFLAHAKPLSANTMTSQNTPSKITMTYTEYVTVYAEPTIELNQRQNDGAWTPDATFQTWVPEPTVPMWTAEPTVPAWTSQPAATKAPATEGYRNGMPAFHMIVAIVATFVGLAFLGCFYFALKRAGCCGCFNWSCCSKKANKRKTTTQWFGNKDLEAGSSGSDNTPPSRVVRSPATYPDRA
jgi:hypothetical protein